MYNTLMKQTIIISVLTISLLSGCNSEKEKEALVKIDKKIEIIDSIIQEYNTLPIDSLKNAYETKLNPMAEFVKRNMTAKVKVEQADLILISDFTDYVKGLKKVMPLATKTTKGLFRLQHQYNTLRTDISKGLIPEDSINYYVTMEEQNFNILKIDIDKVLELKNVGKLNLKKELKTDSILQLLFPKRDSL